MNDINRRNSESFRLITEFQNKKIEDLAKELQIVKELISSYSQEIAILRTQVLTQKVLMTGTGPSVKHE